MAYAFVYGSLAVVGGLVDLAISQLPQASSDLTISLFLPRGAYADVGIKAFTDESSNACDDQQAKDAAADRSAPDQGKPGSGTGCVTLALVPR